MLTKKSIYYINSCQKINELIYLLTNINCNQDLIENKDIIRIRIIDLVHSIGDIFSRIEKKTINDSCIIYGFQYVNNQIKHNKELEIVFFLSSAKESTYFYPYHYGKPCCCWSNIKVKGTKGQRLRTYYEKYLMNINVRETCMELLDYLNTIINDE